MFGQRQGAKILVLSGYGYTTLLMDTGKTIYYMVIKKLEGNCHTCDTCQTVKPPQRLVIFIELAPARRQCSCQLLNG